MRHVAVARPMVEACWQPVLASLQVSAPPPSCPRYKPDAHLPPAPYEPDAHLSPAPKNRTHISPLPLRTGRTGLDAALVERNLLPNSHPAPPAGGAAALADPQRSLPLLRYGLDALFRCAASKGSVWSLKRRV